MYLFLNSNDSKSLHPDNKPFNFTVELPTPLELRGDWKCALAEISYPKSIRRELYVYCDICEYSYIADGYKPILRIVKSGDIYNQLFYQPITTSLVSRIKIYIKDETGIEPSVDVESLRCTLKLKHGK